MKVVIRIYKTQKTAQTGKGRPVAIRVANSLEKFNRVISQLDSRYKNVWYVYQINSERYSRDEVRELFRAKQTRER